MKKASPLSMARTQLAKKIKTDQNNLNVLDCKMKRCISQAVNTL